MFLKISFRRGDPLRQRNVLLRDRVKVRTVARYIVDARQLVAAKYRKIIMSIL